jgi:site-specific DNA-methyltransferase (adenine-specific)
MQEIYQGDCLTIMKGLNDKLMDMIYLDPPFFTNKTHRLSSRDRELHYSFDDIWDNYKDYAQFMHSRLIEARRILKDTGSIFIHCDKNANHILRFVGEDIFGKENFLSEIIWSYKRWSNSANNLTPNHQTILFFSKTANYKFNKIYSDYSETTNIDQILQKRSRDEHGKAIYARELNGSIVSADEKKGVPLADVWEIPFLNPKAKERTGYPTQKPILLLDRIIEISTDEGDIVLDPFCGSGTTLVAAKRKGRGFVGIDISPEAVDLTKLRLETLVKTESAY